MSVKAASYTACAPDKRRFFVKLALLVSFLCLVQTPVTALAAVNSDLATPVLESSLATRVVQIFIGVTVLSLAPGLAMMVTCLPFMLIVLSILRQGTGLQQAPPNMLIVSVALFLTFYVMEPVFRDIWVEGIAPLTRGEISETTAIQQSLAPLKQFMMMRVSEEALFILHEAKATTEPLKLDDPDASLLIPSFVLCEIQRAFEVGFVILLPFLIIDLLVASILMAMGMLMLPPAIVSLPFKIAFFVLSNAWVSVAGALVRGYTP